MSSQSDGKLILLKARLTFPTKVPSDSLGWIGSLKRTSDKSLFPMALGSCGHRITHQLRPINMNGRSILAVTSRLTPDRSLEVDLAAFHAFQVSQRGTASRKLRVLDEHVGNVVLDGEPGTAPGADQHVSILRKGALPIGHTRRERNSSLSIGTRPHAETLTRGNRRLGITPRPGRVERARGGRMVAIMSPPAR